MPWLAERTSFSALFSYIKIRAEKKSSIEWFRSRPDEAGGGKEGDSLYLGDFRQGMIF
jgi:hypothetical protein